MREKELELAKRIVGSVLNWCNHYEIDETSIEHVGKYIADILRDLNRPPHLTDGENRNGDWVLMPRRLTAENGAKALLIGEYLEPSDFVSWNNIKAIYIRAVEEFGRDYAAPQPSLPSDEEAECFLHNLGYSLEGGAGELLHWLRNKAQGGE